VALPETTYLSLQPDSEELSPARFLNAVASLLRSSEPLALLPATWQLTQFALMMGYTAVSKLTVPASSVDPELLPLLLPLLEEEEELPDEEDEPELLDEDEEPLLLDEDEEDEPELLDEDEEPLLLDEEPLLEDGAAAACASTHSVTH
jgi:hypothetical protein